MIDDQEKEELFTDFCLRMAEMDKEDKKVFAAKNNSAMKLVTRYFNKSKKENEEWLYETDEDGWCYFNYYGLYEAYLALRKAIPYMVNANRLAKLKEGYTRRKNKKCINVLDPEIDIKEAEKAGKMLIDALFRYLKEGR